MGSGERRIGVLSIPEGSPAHETERVIAYLKLHDVDFIVAIASTSAPARLVEGIDVLVTTSDANASTIGASLGDTYLVGAPVSDSVGVVMVAPSLVVSSKVVAP